MKAGFVYLFRLGDFHKIGHSRDIFRRAEAFETLPYEFEIVHAYHSEDARGEERRLHRLHASCRIRGEWFRLSAEQVEAIKAIAGDGKLAMRRESFKIPGEVMAMLREMAEGTGRHVDDVLDDIMRPAIMRDYAAIFRVDLPPAK